MFVLGNKQLEVEATWACQCGRTLCHPSLHRWHLFGYRGLGRWEQPVVMPTTGGFSTFFAGCRGAGGASAEPWAWWARRGPSPGGVFMVSWRVFMVLPECGAWHLSALSGWVLSRAGLLPWALGVGD